MKAQCSRCLRLPMTVCQEARKSQPFHRSEVQTIKRSTARFAYAPLLAQRDRKDCPGNSVRSNGAISAKALNARR